jgi:hypothetical protein
MTITNVLLIKKPSKTMVGPFPVSMVDDYVRAKLVAKDGVPITLYETKEDGAERYAILAPPGKEMRVVCVGCFQPGMSLFDDSRCKKISSYCQHWDNNKGERRDKCKAISPNTLHDCEQRLNNNDGDGDVRYDDGVDLSTVDSDDLIRELIKRESDFEFILPKVDDKTFVQAAKDRGIKIIGECRFHDLEEEMRRISDGSGTRYSTFYAKTKKEGRPHCTDHPMVTDKIIAEYWSNWGTKRAYETGDDVIVKKAKYNTRSTSN